MGWERKKQTKNVLVPAKQSEHAAQKRVENDFVFAVVLIAENGENSPNKV